MVLWNVPGTGGRLGTAAAAAAREAIQTEDAEWPGGVLTQPLTPRVVRGEFRR